MTQSEKAQPVETEEELRDKKTEESNEDIGTETTACGLVVSEDEDEEWQDY